MLNQRQNKILKILGENERTSVNSLSEQLKVSSVTIRQDLNVLEAEGLLNRVHGGAVLKNADDLESRLGINYEQKLRIARKVALQMNEGDTILIESGSVNALLARELAQFRKLTIITTNVYIARQFRSNPMANIILLGGLYQQESETLVGQITRTCIDQLSIDKAFIGIDGYISGHGFMVRDLLRAEISRHIIRKARDVYVVTDSTKFGRTGLTSVCQLSDVQHVATDDDLPSGYKQEFTKAGIEVILA
jgi:DeoR/GlpR family transcriptional regulator of sugar metabolism